MSINWQAFQLTVELAVIVSAILFAIGLPLASWIPPDSSSGYGDTVRGAIASRRCLH